VSLQPIDKNRIRNLLKNKNIIKVDKPGDVPVGGV
jgi:hypothetical protein